MKEPKDNNKDDSLPPSEKRLDNVTKGRVKGPQGRRLPRKPGHRVKSSELLDPGISLHTESDEETPLKTRGRATSLTALEATCGEHGRSRLSFELGCESDDNIALDLPNHVISATNKHNDNLSSPFETSISNDPSSPSRASFEQAWFITLPSDCKPSKEEYDIESTSDYSSLNGSPSSTSKSQLSKRSLSSSPASSKSSTHSLKSRIEKFVCSLL